MTTPSELRALADRVCAEEPSRELDAEIAEAMGHRVEWKTANYTMETYPVIYWQPPHPYAGMHEPCPRFTSSLDDAAAMMPAGWWFEVWFDVTHQLWEATADNPERTIHETSGAPTEPRARTALACRVRAAMMEDGDG